MSSLCRKCVNACNCIWSNDGIEAGHPEFGRNTNDVAGSGTTEDPFVISFLDQKEFRPRTAEINYSNLTIPSAATYKSAFSNTTSTSTLLYESSIHFVLRDFLQPNFFPYSYANLGFAMIGASVTFAQVSDTKDKIRGMVLTAVRGLAFPAETYILGGQTTPGGVADHPFTDNNPLTLSCEGIASGVFFVNPLAPAIKQELGLYILQNSGSDLLISNIKIWMTEI